MSQEVTGCQTIEEAWMQLPEVVKQHSVRVSEYMKVFFRTAMEVGVELQGDGEEELDADSLPYIADAGRYHEIGLLELSEEARQQYIDGYSRGGAESEQQIAQGLQIIDFFQKKEEAQKEKVQKEKTQKNKTDTYWKILQKIIQNQHERPDGSGCPQGVKITQLPLLAWMGVLADMLDLYTAFRHEEKPFERGYDQILRWLGTNQPEAETEKDLFSELTLLLKYSKSKLARIFHKHQSETQIITYRTPIIKQRKNRPMQLHYRPVRDKESQKICALEAKPVFYQKGKYLEFEELKEELQEENIIPEIWKYFLYEASDMTERMAAYGMGNVAIYMQTIPEALDETDETETIKTWLEETGIDPAQLIFFMDPRPVEETSGRFRKNIEQLKASGIAVILREPESENKEEDTDSYQNADTLLNGILQNTK